MSAGRETAIVYRDRRGIGAEADIAKRAEAEANRLQAIKNAAAIPESWDCGPDIAPAPARGGIAREENIELLPVGAEQWMRAHRGYGGRKAIRGADVFDAMIAAALRTKRDIPLQPGQIAMGRHYRDLDEWLSADGTRLSRLESSFGSGGNGNWMDRRLQLSNELSGIRRRIGTAPALQVRRIRPSQRGADQRGLFTSRDLVDMVCLQDCSIKQVLDHFGWQTNGRNSKAALEALRATLDRMIGYRDEKSP
ncbi:hypothetical protein A7A09_008915 [Paracoccus methylarcula]|uniref:Uncharacterized protein n=1 Tax=Paracoccus methylarcula TaxID=72022 RepID=A0A422QYX8_9RHOB|nr:hypothetical protein A7A09_008915 [Paracoccus methylarcula]